MFKNGARVLKLMRSMQKNGFQTDIWINNECQIGFVTNREELWRRGGGEFFFYRRPGTNIFIPMMCADWSVRPTQLNKNFNTLLVPTYS